ncbi:CHAT domain-containing tetratricopeptide repeat protein [Flavobacteriaceae bacterium S356]|uniref:CHAT domain-containing tetratricopeptide repeat protein n=1 Tax=Asprobacillus argus TaxID=3076534 RepID=A0ABU3LHE1_9FLAO|nr:CHAT domain-containing tetratricopeptide repeat protein [Flavobacteriaceae bacterium S356]
MLIQLCMGVVFLFFTSFVSSQSTIKSQVDKIYTSKHDYSKKILLTKELFSKIDSTKYTKDLGYIYHKLGLLFKRNKEYKKAILAIQKAIVVRKSLDTIDQYALSNSKYNLSVYYELTSQYKKQLTVLKEVIKDNFPTKFTYKVCIKLAEILSNKGDYYTAFQYLQRAIDSYDQYKDLRTLVLAHSQYIRIYALMEESGRNLKDIELHKRKLDSLYDGGISLTVSNNLAVIYEDTGLIDEAIDQYQKVLDVYLTTDNVESIATVYNNLGRMYARKGEHTKATDSFLKALEISKDDAILAMTYDNQGYYLQTDQSISKVPYYMKAVHTLLGDSNVKKLPTFDQVKGSTNKLDILNYLIDIAEALVAAYKEENQNNYLIRAEETLFLIDELVSLIRFDSSVDQSKLFWIRKSVNTYMLAVQVSYLLGNTKNAFYFMEKNKALLLLENLTGSVQQPTILSLEESVQKHVNEQTYLLEYILNDTDGFGIFCSKDEQLLFKIQDAPLVSKLVDQYKDLVREPLVTTEALTRYNETSAALFTLLFPFKNAFERLKNKHLIVIPDHTLQSIPFDALKATPKSNYLVEDITISYLQSSSVFHALNKQDEEAAKRILAVAPIDFKDQNLISLSRAKNDIEQISDLYSGDQLIGKKATKGRFLDCLEDYRLIHINTHAGFDSIQKTPWIAFYDKKLSLNEVYTHNNNAELIVLDACKSGDGSLEIGEGVMSLARGFFYNGTKSVIASQWNSNEKSNNEILLSFYTSLQKGNTKAHALREAKLDYINTHQLSERSPYYWASLSLTGNIEAIDLTIPFYMRLELWGAALILFFIFLSMRRRKNEV